MKIQSNMYINNPDMTSRNIEKKKKIVLMLWFRKMIYKSVIRQES